MKGINVANSTALTIGGTAVRQVGDLYSLNDLHKESGGQSKHQPHEFLRIEQTKALVAELSNSGDSRNYLETKRGKYGGTYACKELVIAYAAWISAKFHLKVIRVFLAVTTPKAAESAGPISLTDSPEKAKVGKLLATARKRAAQHLARLDKEIATWELVDEHKAPAIPASQIEEISTRLDRVGKLFHPFSDQFADLLAIKRALRGQDPRAGFKNEGWMEILPTQQLSAQGAAA
ncbi:KilA-N domain-containing protein [Delftia acidovorans]|nr:KilA-N domain-containing protein [Delftia acidovorans]QPS74823.1 KilA-N domain-containing protein [Delftia acidovorans]